jgi:hypothetical protein
MTPTESADEHEDEDGRAKNEQAALVPVEVLGAVSGAQNSTRQRRQ